MGSIQKNKNVGINLDDGASITAFGRLRTAGTGQRLDVEFIYDKQEDLFDEITNNGVVTYNSNSRDLTLSLSDANDGSYAEMRSHPVPYTPGNSQLIDITGVLDFAGIGGGEAEIFLRSKISGTVEDIVSVAQDSWFSLTGASDIDWSKSHIFMIDFQSLKVGRIRFYIVKDGLPVNVYSISNDNLRNTGYWQLASLPVSWKIYNTATETISEIKYGNDDNAIGFRYRIAANASATMKAICCTVKSEGGISLQNLEGLPRTINNLITSKTVSTTLIPIISIRVKSTYKTLDNLAIALPKSYAFQTDQPVLMVAIYDGVLTGASWVDVDATDSIMEYDVTASAISNGVQLASIYATTSIRNNADSVQGLLGKAVMWARKSSQTGIVTIAAIRTGGSDASCKSTINWEEQR